VQLCLGVRGRGSHHAKDRGGRSSLVLLIGGTARMGGCGRKEPIEEENKLNWKKNPGRNHS